MKKNFTPLFYAKVLALSLFFCLPNLVKAQLFSQNFNDATSENLAPYTGSGANQFDFLGAATGGATASSVRVFNATYPNQLRLFRGTSAIASFARTTDFSPTPSALKITFTLNAPSTTTFATAGVFYVGSSFAASATGESGTVHSQFGVGFTSTVTPYVSGTYNLRNMNSFLNTPDITGSITITWYINNSGASISYNNPAGGTSSVGDDKSDVWIGTTNPGNLNEVSAAGGTNALTDFKFSFTGGGGIILVDDIVVSNLPLSLPVTLTSFTANKAESANQLTWATASEQNASHYTVERSLDAQNFVEIGKVTAQGKAATYNFADDAPLSISYYRLRQVDFDGAETFSKIVSVSQDTKGRISITPNPTSDKVNINLNQNEVSNQTTMVVLSDMTGRQVLTQTTTAGAFQLDLSNLAKGIYVMTLQSNNAIYQEKIIRQ